MLNGSLRFAFRGRRRTNGRESPQIEAFSGGLAARNSMLLFEALFVSRAEDWHNRWTASVF